MRRFALRSARTGSPQASSPTSSRAGRDADRLLVRTVATSRRSAAVLVLGVALRSFTSLLIPAAIAAALDSASREQGLAQAVRPSVLLVLGVLASAAVLLGSVYTSARAAVWLRVSLARHVLAVGQTGTRDLRHGDLVTRLVGNASETAEASYGLISLLSGFVTPICGVLALWAIDWTVALAFLLTAAPITTISSRFFRSYSRNQSRYQEIQGELSASLSDVTDGARSIAAMGTAQREIDRVLQPLARLSAEGRESWTAQKKATWRSSLLAPVCEFTVLVVAGFKVSAGDISPGSLVAVTAYTAMALGLLDNLDPLARLARVRASAGRLVDVLGRPTPEAGEVTPPVGPGALTLRSVTVTRGDQVVLDAVDLDVPAGSKVAVVGRSGSGKSALAGVIGHLVRPDSGEVRLDGVPVSTMAPAARARSVVYAFARPEPLGGTVGDDITYGLSPEPTDEETVASARTACADAFIDRLPGGYGTPLHGLALSGGERQRLGLARAAARLKGACVLVLDEATSHLDALTEVLVGRAFDTGRTEIAVTYRAATAARADVVLWMEDGRIREAGPHDRLWNIPAYRSVLAVDGGAVVTPLEAVCESAKAEHDG
ncbi:ABC transporter ATP-binding protein [Streptomyces sp. CB02009]|uniref:ABC transporter ATP-binding protein n=1 Tax=Streptomyces sp. CB02009 TaxID=1703938 RepID=UPI00093E0F55|nr:ABC transporter ATP-binding protein [Streptomyces sp. CB02009]